MPQVKVPRGVPQTILWILLIIASFLLGSLYTKVKYLEKGGTPTTTTTTQQQAPTKAVVTLDQVKDAFNKSIIKFGNADSKLVLIEVADPSCPYCHVAAGLNPELNKQIGDRFTLVADGGNYVAPVPEMKKLVDADKASFAWLYTPGHGNGEMGTKALYCAFESNKFWEVHDALMTSEGYDLLNNTIKNDNTKSVELSQFLASVFDENQMKECLDSGKHDSRLQEDVQIASGIGISGTPGFYINATNFSGAYSYTEMESAINL
ncbi:MAG: DsbA oxidoreductase [uncultured bacterium]|uniref:Thioredoxin-like fold domain-containing protein n=1 Tax=Candidatus Gottesmanbacteria bacterium RIFCSPLOWO2_01_FULL_43_11b TaxID=1798392 RepID=A0A1F6AIW7_9BACT|nr:MAG: DsbA oxidoreductase [uncultured bacterium]OGG24383.1 MAG: hypothetical protein A3A79_04330 [Candidatus Gottesmanbacteria bacterium RIFCSPLOWO2_01_FULL_43_11b]